MLHLILDTVLLYCKKFKSTQHRMICTTSTEELLLWEVYGDGILKGLEISVIFYFSKE